MPPQPFSPLKRQIDLRHLFYEQHNHVRLRYISFPGTPEPLRGHRSGDPSLAAHHQYWCFSTLQPSFGVDFHPPGPLPGLWGDTSKETRPKR